MYKEHTKALLNHDVTQYDLKAGDIGTIVHCYPEGKAYEVEFVTAGGHTIALLTLEPVDIRRMLSTEILHARQTA